MLPITLERTGSRGYEDIRHRRHRRVARFLSALPVLPLALWLILHRHSATDDLHTAIWWGVLLAASLCALLSLAAHWWSHPLLPLQSERHDRLPDELLAWWDTHWWFWALIVLIVILGFVLRLVPARQSLTREESQNLSASVLGQWSEAPAPRAFHPATWSDTLHPVPGPAASPLFNLASRLSLASWRALTLAEPATFSETAFRLPALLAGLLSIVLAGALLRQAGFLWPGLAASLLLALHPWHIQLSATGQGASLLIFFTLLSAYLTLKSARHGHWGWWLLLALALALAIWSHPSALPILPLTWLLLAPALLLTPSGDNTPLILPLRATITTLLALILLLLLDAPSILPFPTDLPPSAPTVADLWPLLILGLPLAWPQLLGFPYPVILIYQIFLLGILPVLLLAGILRVLAAGRNGAFALLIPAATLPLLLLAATLWQLHLTPATFSLGLAPLLALILIGPESIAFALQREQNTLHQILLWTCALLLALLFLPSLILRLTRPPDPLREASFALGPPNTTASYATSPLSLWLSPYGNDFRTDFSPANIPALATSPQPLLLALPADPALIPPSLAPLLRDGALTPAATLDAQDPVHNIILWRLPPPRPPITP